MEMRTLGRTGLKVSAAGLGAWEIGYLPSRAEAFRVLDMAVDGGINLIDTSDNYGESERYIGAWLTSRRPSVIIATKITCGPEWKPADMAAVIDRSLKRLRTDVIDIVQLHNPGPDKVRQGDVFTVLQKAQEAGKIRFTGLSEDTPTAQACLEQKPYDVLQTDYSMVTRGGEASLLPFTSRQGIGVTTRMAFARFVYKRALQYDWEKPMKDRAESLRLTEWFDRYPDYSHAELLLRFALSNSRIHSVLIGTGSPVHLAENISFALKGPLPNEILKDFDVWCEAHPA